MIARLKDSIRLYKHYVSINVRSMMQYKTSFLLTAIGQFLVSFNVFLGIYFMFQRFHTVNGFTYSEVLLCFSIMLLEFSLAEMFARGFDAFSGMVRSGSFDQILVRPRNEILQVLGSKFELTRIGRMLQSLVMFAYGVSHCDVAWNPARVMTVFHIFAWRDGSVFRVVSDICGSVFLYSGRVGIHERFNRRRKGIRQISRQHLRQKDVTHHHFHRPLCPGTILPAPVSIRKKEKSVSHIRPVTGGPILSACLCIMAVWCETLYFQRFMTSHYFSYVLRK